MSSWNGGCRVIPNLVSFFRVFPRHYDSNTLLDVLVGADREEELKKNQEEVRKKQYEHFSAKLKEDAEKRAEDQQRAAEERAQRFNATGDTTDGKPRTLPSKSYGGGGFSHMNSASKSSRSAVRKVQPRQS